MGFENSASLPEISRDTGSPSAAITTEDSNLSSEVPIGERQKGFSPAYI